MENECDFYDFLAVLKKYLVCFCFCLFFLLFVSLEADLIPIFLKNKAGSRKAWQTQESGSGEQILRGQFR